MNNKKAIVKVKHMLLCNRLNKKEVNYLPTAEDSS